MKKIKLIIVFMYMLALCTANAKSEVCTSAELEGLNYSFNKSLLPYFQNKFYSPFRGKKVYCSAEHNQKAFITITGNKVNIIIGKRKITGTYKKKEILLTNDPDEIEYRKNAPGKYHYGSYYVIGKDYFSILLAENGEYDYYVLCK